MSAALADFFLAVAILGVLCGIGGMVFLALDFYRQRKDAETFQDREFHPTPQYRPRCAPLQHDWILPPNRAGYCARCGEPLDLRPIRTGGTDGWSTHSFTPPHGTSVVEEKQAEPTWGRA